LHGSLHVEPAPGAFTHRIEVRSADIDELGHVGNVTWVRWVNDAAAAHSLSVGLDLEAYRKLGVLWVVRRHDVLYLASAFENDSLEAVTWIESARGAASLRRTVVYRSVDRTVLLRAATTWALVNIASGKPTRIPADLARRYGEELTRSPRAS
jgi:acyl-CoA thioester hydrolase